MFKFLVAAAATLFVCGMVVMQFPSSVGIAFIIPKIAFPVSYVMALGVLCFFGCWRVIHGKH